MYYPLDSGVVAMADLSSAAKLIHAYLVFIQRDDRKSYPRVGTIAKSLGLRNRQAMRGIADLEGAGLLKVTRRRGTSSLYEVQTTTDCGTGTESGTTAGIGTGVESGGGVVPKSTPHQCQNRQGGSTKNDSLPEFLPESLPESLEERAIPPAEESAPLPYGPEQDPITKAVIDFFGGSHRVYASRFREAEDVADRIGEAEFITGLAAAKKQGKRWDPAIAWIRERAKSASRTEAWTETDVKRKKPNTAPGARIAAPCGKYDGIGTKITTTGNQQGTKREADAPDIPDSW